MLSLDPVFARTKDFIHNSQRIVSNIHFILSSSSKTLLLFAKRTYIFLNMVVSKICDFLSLILQTTAEATILTIAKMCALYRHIHRRIYVWKILSARHKWYKTKKGNLYNPRLNATISPTWVCSWNLSGFNEHYEGLESKERAQDVAFKRWMKKRLLQKRLKSHSLEERVPIKLTEKIISSSKILPNKIQLRDATLDDMPQLIALIEKNGYSQSIDGIKSQIKTYLTESNHHILITIRAKKIVGFIAFVIYDLFLSKGKRCRIEGLIVDMNQPDLTVKRRLMQAAEAYARDHNSKIIDFIDNFCCTKDGSHDFYRFLGYNGDASIAKAYLRKEL